MIDIQSRIWIARNCGIDVVLPGGASASAPVVYELTERLDFRGLHGSTIRADGPMIWRFDVDDDVDAPLIDRTNSIGSRLSGDITIVVERGKSACAILDARSNPGMSANWNTLEGVRIRSTYEDDYRIAARVVLGAEHTRDVDVFAMTGGVPALWLASTNAGLGIKSPFGPVAYSDDDANGTPPVSQWLYLAENCGFTALDSESGVHVGRGCGGWTFSNCNVAAHLCETAYQIGDGTSPVRAGRIGGMIEGTPKYSIRLGGPAINCNFNGPLHTSQPWTQGHPTWADEVTATSLNALIANYPTAGYAD